MHWRICEDNCSPWVELAQGREITSSMRVIQGEVFVGGTQKVAVQNGSYYRCLDVLLMLLRRAKGSAHPSWNFVSLKSERWFPFPWIVVNEIYIYFFETSIDLEAWGDVLTLLQDISKYSTFSMLPKDISQQIFNELVESHCLSDSSLEAFRDCALEVIL